MFPLHRLLLLVVLTTGCMPFAAQSQQLYRSKIFRVTNTPLQIDSVSIVKNSMTIFALPSHQPIDTSSYTVNAERGVLVWKQLPACDSVLVRYTVLQFAFYKTYRRKNYALLNKTDSLARSGFLYTPQASRNDALDLGGVNYNGSFVRGVSFGNNQDVVLNSAFNLQMDGNLPGGIQLSAALTDNNVPVQPEGNTQQLQEFDKVFIRLKKDKTALTVGDYEVGKPPGYFLNFNKKLQGARLQTDYDVTKTIKGSSDVGVAVAKGKYAKNQFNGQEGNQGPYKLTGANGEMFIIVLSGSEAVYIDGIRMQRGADLDYVIDYNDGDVTFTPKRLINAASRITVEFEYSDKNYFRTLLAGSEGFDFGKVNVRVNVYSEQDNKNQPVQQDLDSTKRRILANAGDSLNQAVVPGIDSVGFDANKIRYKKVIQPVFGYIYVYSTSPDSAVYDLKFSFVGVNKGNYAIANTAANGRVYKWVSPLNGVPQGSYEPYIQLTPPQLQQMVTGHVDYMPDKQTTLSLEGAVSRKDVNTFSSKDNADNDGAAMLASAERKFKLQPSDKNTALLTANVRYEFDQRTFNPVEVFRPVEFERDWNLNTSKAAGLQNIVGSMQLTKTNVYSLQVQSGFLQRDTFYRGTREVLNGTLTKKRWTLNTANSITISKSGLGNSRFTRPMLDVGYLVSKKFPVTFGVKTQAEDNRITARNADTLTAAAFRWYDYGAYVKRPDSLKLTAAVGYARRYDERARGNRFRTAQYSDNVESNFGWRIADNQQVNATINYRKVHAIDTLLIHQRSDESLATRLEHNGVFKNGFLNLNTVYELGSGLQQKQQFVYVQVPAGQGVFAYLGDLNGNGVKDLNEFEVAAFQDQAEYIKVFIPTNQYVKVYAMHLSHALSLQPRSLWHKATGLKGFAARWSDVFSVQLDNKFSNLSLAKAANPFTTSAVDTQLVSSANLLSNVLSFNRTDPFFGIDFNWQRSADKSLLNNGFESRAVTGYGARIRWNLTRKITFTQNLQRDRKQNRSQYFITRNYNINGYTLEPNAAYQFGSASRLQLGYSYRDAKNMDGETHERLVNNKVSLQLRTGAVGKSLLTLKADYARVGYTGAANTPLAYAMLEGLQRGNNMLWNVTLERKLSKVLEMSLSYDGRKTGTAAAVHVGRMQVQALF